MSRGLPTALLLGAALLAAAAHAAGTPARTRLEGPGITGTLWRHASFPSAHVPARHVDVWLPPGYDAGDRRYPVVYMHDGQNLFDPATAYGGTDWAVDEAMTRLVNEGTVRPAIVVGVWNSPQRFAEYMPQRGVSAPVSSGVPGGPAVAPGALLGDRYLAFLVEELKPFVDRTYRTLPGRTDTVIMGSSMGGLVSQYAMSRYPEVFGGAGCVSTHWPAGGGVALEDFERHLPDPATHRYWLDYGTATLDATYEPFQRRADAILRRAGYVEGRDWITRKYPGAEHSEKAWRARVDQPLVFLLGGP